MTKFVELGHPLNDGEATSARFVDELGQIPLASFMRVPGIVVDAPTPPRVVAVEVDESTVRDKAVLIRTGWDKCWGTCRYQQDAPYLAELQPPWKSPPRVTSVPSFVTPLVRVANAQGEGRVPKGLVRKGRLMQPRFTLARGLRVVAIAVAALAVAASAGTSRDAAAALPPGNTVAQWNQITEDTVLGVGMLADEGFIYMAYPSAAVYDAVVAIEGGFEPYGPAIDARAGASVDAAVVEAAYRTLWAYFAPESCNPASAAYAFCLGVRPRLNAFYAEALSAIPPGQAKADGQAVGLQAASDIIALRSDDGRMTPFGVTSPFPTLPPGPGVWRLTPPFAAPRTPWVGNVRRFIMQSVDQFLPDPPPPLQSDEWVEAFNQIKAYGASHNSARTDEQTRIAQFWSASVIRQYNRVGRDVTSAATDLLEPARLLAMVNLVGADALMSGLHGKYHYLLWRPVTAIDPTAVTADGFGPVPGFDDGNPGTVEQVGWRPLLTTPNHPEYPAAHGVITSAMAEVFTGFRGTNQIDLDIYGFDPAGPNGNLTAVRHFDRANELRQEIIDARLWGGLHYHFSSVAGVVLGRDVANYDLRHAFRPVG